jgi:type IV secretory pathway component VirB8
MPADDLNRSIESGEFYKEARQWYLYKYIFPVIERSMLIAVSIASVMAAIVSLYIVATTLFI